MKLINPIGRIVNLGLEENKSPRACMCSEYGGNFAGARGTNDHCFRCGCDCSGSGNRKSGNRQGATTAVWSS